MASMSQFIGILLLWTVGQMLSLAVSGLMFWNAGFSNILNGAAAYNVAQVSGAGTLSLPTFGPGFFTTTIPTMLSWNYPIFVGSLQIVQVLLLTITAGLLLWFFMSAMFALGNIFRQP